MSPTPTLLGDLQIGNALGNLAIARATKLDEATALVYTKQLEDLDPGLVERACVQLANAPRAAFETALPAVGDIRARVLELAREDAVQEAARKLLPLPKPDEESPTYFCLDCRDEPSGWRMFWCHGKPIAMSKRHEEALPAYACSRSQPHAPHSYVERCPCLPTNPVIARARERATRKSAERAA